MPFRPDEPRAAITGALGLVDAARQVSQLGPTHIVVAALDIRRFDPLPARVLETLSESEHATAGRFRFAADRQRFVLARSMVRHLVGAAAGTAPAEVRLVSTAYGKPCLADPDASVHFNVSHSGDLVLVALAHEPVGVDIEQHRSGMELPAIAASCFSPAERSDIFVTPEDAHMKFFRYWACKEAWIKADGRGLSLPLVDFTLTGVEDGVCRVQHAGSALPWRVQRLEVREGYEAAVASTDVPWTVGLYTIV
jgi:4'-phosphopantetheinyl transferase